jgi:transcriptional regulator with GAF, ATPase, and Fis domain
MASDEASLTGMAEPTGSIGSEGPCRSKDDGEWLDLDTLAGDAGYIGGMVVGSAHLREMFRTIARIGPHRSTVLIQGESGTGKELVARALHLMGPAPKGPFVTFNCSNLVETLAESQLFGHVRGAFTDAREDSLGYFRSAGGGTLFLDEIGELPLRLQPKLLRAVETKEVQPVGSTRSYHVDIRLVAATNRDLRAMVRAGHFRDDLFYRLNASSITIPPLRERREAIGALAAHFIEHSNRLLGRQVGYLSRRALAVLEAYEWPGNVRELAHAIESAVVLAEADRIDACHLPDYLTAVTQYPGDRIAQSRAWLDSTEGAAPHAHHAREPGRETAEPVHNPVLSLDEVIKQTLLRSLEETGGNRRRAAELLKISRSTLYRMLARYELADLTRRHGSHFAHPRAVSDHPKESHT